jgi:hypothetical protein
MRSTKVACPCYERRTRNDDVLPWGNADVALADERLVTLRRRDRVIERDDEDGRSDAKTGHGTTEEEGEVRVMNKQARYDAMQSRRP